MQYMHSILIVFTYYSMYENSLRKDNYYLDFFQIRKKCC